jgi:hypothetical protein
LDLIHNSLNARTGCSKLFDKKDLEDYQISSSSDLFLLFLPNFSLHTYFHYLLINNNFELFHKIASNLEEFFQDFISNDVYIDKIIEILAYILENVTIFPKSAIKRLYCSLNYDSNNEFEDDDEIKLVKNVEKVTKYLIEIEELIQKNPKFSRLDGFNVLAC